MKPLILCLLGLASSVLAGPEVWLETSVITPEVIDSVKADLHLSAEQEEKMKSLAGGSQEETAALEKKIREEQKNLTRLLRQADTTQAQASEALTRLLEAEAAVKQARLANLLALRDVLTPEQQKQALALAPGKSSKKDGAERLKATANSLRAALDELGIPPTSAMQTRGLEVEILVSQGELKAAEEAMGKLVADSGLHSKETVTAPDFSQYSPGETDLDSLKQRYKGVAKLVDSVVSLPLMKQVLMGKKALEEAKAAEDAVMVGRILTWAEETLK